LTSLKDPIEESYSAPRPPKSLGKWTLEKSGEMRTDTERERGRRRGKRKGWGKLAQ